MKKKFKIDVFSFMTKKAWLVKMLLKVEQFLV